MNDWEPDPELPDPQSGVHLERSYVVGPPASFESYDYRVIVERAGSGREVAFSRGDRDEIGAAYWAAVRTAEFLSEPRAP